MINLKTYSFNGNNKVYLDDKTLTVNPNNTSFPVTLSANMPSDGKAAYVEVVVQGLTCSECANGYGDPQEQPYANCPNMVVFGSSPFQYIAARPQWFAVLQVPAYLPTINMYNVQRTMNVPNTCGCYVN